MLLDDARPHTPSASTSEGVCPESPIYAVSSSSGRLITSDTAGLTEDEQMDLALAASEKASQNAYQRSTRQDTHAPRGGGGYTHTRSASGYSADLGLASNSGDEGDGESFPLESASSNHSRSNSVASSSDSYIATANAWHAAGTLASGSTLKSEARPEVRNTDTPCCSGGPGTSAHALAHTTATSPCLNLHCVGYAAPMSRTARRALNGHMDVRTLECYLRYACLAFTLPPQWNALRYCHEHVHFSDVARD